MCEQYAPFWQPQSDLQPSPNFPPSQANLQSTPVKPCGHDSGRFSDKALGASPSNSSKTCTTNTSNTIFPERMRCLLFDLVSLLLCWANETDRLAGCELCALLDASRLMLGTPSMPKTRQNAMQESIAVNQDAKVFEMCNSSGIERAEKCSNTNQIRR
jgi:hypothetical protein